MKIKNLLWILILMISWSGVKAQKGFINITNYPDTIHFSDTLMIEVLSHVKDNNICSPLTSVKDTLSANNLSYDLTFDFTGVWQMGSCSRIDTLYYYNLPQLDSITLTCYYTFVDSNQSPPIMASRFDTASVVIYIENTTSLKEFQNKNAFHIYPNPSNGMIELNFENEMLGKTNLKVFDLLGYVVHAENAMNKKIDLSHLSKGMYLLSLENGSERYTKKLVLK